MNIPYQVPSLIFFFTLPFFMSCDKTAPANSSTEKDPASALSSKASVNRYNGPVVVYQEDGYANLISSLMQPITVKIDNQSFDNAMTIISGTIGIPIILDESTLSDDLGINIDDLRDHPVKNDSDEDPFGQGDSSSPLSDIIEIDDLRDNPFENDSDEAPFDQGDLSSRYRVTANFKNIPPISALNVLARRLDPEMTFAIRDHHIVITTKEESRENLITGLYPVNDLVTFTDEKGSTFRDFDSLMELITSTIQPESWDDMGGEGMIAPWEFDAKNQDLLVISHTLPVHLEVQHLLTLFRHMRNDEEFANGPRRRKQIEGGFGNGGLGSF